MLAADDNDLAVGLVLAADDLPEGLVLLFAGLGLPVRDLLEADDLAIGLVLLLAGLSDLLADDFPAIT